MARKLEKIVKQPKPSAESVRQAKAKGAEIVPLHPGRLKSFLEGRITLADLEGISKETQYSLAQVGYKFLTDGQVSQARVVFRGLVALDPYDAYFQGTLASIEHREGRLKEALKYYNRSLEINPYSCAARAGRGELLLSQGKLEAALSDLFEAVELDKKGEQPASHRARVIINTLVKKAGTSDAAPQKASPARKGSPLPRRPRPQKGQGPKGTRGRARPPRA